MRNKLRLASKIVLAAILVLFGVPILTNIHLAYLRALSQWTVKITTKAHNSGATGFVVTGKSGDKYIMTNNHVCELARENSGVLLAQYRGEEFEVTVYRDYIWNDLCAMTAHHKLGLSVNIASSVSKGETIYVIGHPLLEPTSVASGELTDPIFVTISTKENPKPEECFGPTYRILDTSDTYLSLFGVNSICLRTVEANPSTATTQPGNSGSPVVNIYGNVVGVDFAGNGAGRAYFVPLEDLQAFLEEL